MSDALKRLAELAASLPRGLRSDWKDTNHFELTSDDDEYWWLDLKDMGVLCDTDDGERLGLLMDIAEEVARLRDSGVLGE